MCACMSFVRDNLVEMALRGHQVHRVSKVTVDQMDLQAKQDLLAPL